MLPRRVDEGAGNQDIPITWTVSYEMNHREPPHLPVGVRQALHCLALLLLPAMSPGGAQAPTRPRSSIPGGPHAGIGLPYLPALGAMSLRFQEAAPPPDLSTRPAAAAPPTPALSPTETTVALANAAAASRPVAAPPPREASSAPATPAAEPAPTPAKPVPGILPDDVRPAVKPEDFLPYFQLPGAAKAPGDVSVIVPAPRSAPAAPAAIPPSSAAYSQSPR